MKMLGAVSTISIIVLFAAMLGCRHDQPAAQPKTDGPKQWYGVGIDAPTIAAYQKIGGIYGGWHPKEPFQDFQPGANNAEEGLPGFQVFKFPVADYPPVTVPFGLNFKESELTDDHLKQLISLKKLAALDLTRTKVTDAGMKELAAIPSLTTLVLSGTKVTPAGLKELAPLKNLTRLEISDFMVTDAGTRMLGGTQITDTDLRVLREIGLLHALSRAYAANGARPRNVDEVVRISLPSTKVTHVGLKEFAGFKNVTTLSGVPLTDDNLQSISEIGLLHAVPEVEGKDKARPKSADDVVSLRLISTNGSAVTDAGFKHFTRFKNLTIVYLWGSRVSDASMPELAHFKKLESLTLSANVTNAGLEHVAALQNLTTLEFWMSPVSDEGLKLLAPLKKLKSLAFFHSGKRITDKGLRNLREVGLLHVLASAKGKNGTRPASLDEVVEYSAREYSGSPPITDAGLEELAFFKNLTTLSLAGCADVTDRGAKRLASFRNLTSLELGGTKVSDSAEAELRKALPNCTIKR